MKIKELKEILKKLNEEEEVMIYEKWGTVSIRQKDLIGLWTRIFKNQLKDFRGDERQVSVATVLGMFKKIDGVIKEVNNAKG